MSESKQDFAAWPIGDKRLVDGKLIQCVASDWCVVEDSGAECVGADHDNRPSSWHCRDMQCKDRCYVFCPEPATEQPADDPCGKMACNPADNEAVAMAINEQPTSQCKTCGHAVIESGNCHFGNAVSPLPDSRTCRHWEAEPAARDEWDAVTIQLPEPPENYEWDMGSQEHRSFFNYGSHDPWFRWEICTRKITPTPEQIRERVKCRKCGKPAVMIARENNYSDFANGYLIHCEDMCFTTLWCGILADAEKLWADTNDPEQVRERSQAWAAEQVPGTVAVFGGVTWLFVAETTGFIAIVYPSDHGDRAVASTIRGEWREWPGHLDGIGPEHIKFTPSEEGE